MVRVDGPVDRAWSAHEVTLEDVTLAHLADGKAECSNTAWGADMIWLSRQHRKQAFFLPAALTALAAVLITLYLSRAVR